MLAKKTRKIPKMQKGAKTKKASHPEKKRHKEAVKKGDDLPGLRTRSAPTQLYKAVVKLSKKQRESVREMGLGRMLKFRMDGIPSKIAHFVVDKFNPERMEIDLGNIKLLIDEEKIETLFGLKDEGTILEVTTKKKLGTIAKAWKSRYGKSYITRAEVVSKMSEDADTPGAFFKIDFIALFSSVMAESGSNEYMKLDFVPSIIDGTDLNNINWNKYCLDALRRCKDSWVSGHKGPRFTGPLALLTLVYVDSITCPGINVERSMSPLKFWTSESLKIREDYEIENGGFGLGELRETYVDNEGDASDEEMSKGREVTEKKQKEVREKSNLKDHIDGLEELFALMQQHKKVTEEALQDAWSLFPNNDELMVYIERYKSFYKTVVQFSQKEKENEDAGDTNEDMETVISNSAGIKSVSWMKHDKSMPSFDFGIDLSQSTQDSDKTETVSNNVEKDIMMVMYTENVGKTVQEEHKSSEDTNKEIVEGPESTKVDDTSRDDNSGEAAVVTSTVDNKNGNGGESDENVIYERKPVEINTPMNEEERIMWQYLMSFVEDLNKGTPKEKQKEEEESKKMTNEEREEEEKKKMEEKEKAEVEAVFNQDFFETASGVQTKPFLLATLEPGKEVFAEVVDCWAAVQNIEEKWTTKNAPKHLCCYTTTVIEWMYKTNTTKKQRLEKFAGNLKHVLSWNKKLLDLKSFDTIVIPILENQHFYLVCFDLDAPGIAVIDNMDEATTPIIMKDANAYQKKGTPFKVKDMVCSYLRHVKHPKAAVMELATPRRMNLRWATKNNYTDCGLFAMRHMEVYRGRKKEFDCGFSDENEKQESQVNNLRMRYATKLLTTKANKYREYVMKEAEIMNKRLTQHAGKSKRGKNRDVEFLKRLQSEYEKVEKDLEVLRNEAAGKHGGGEIRPGKHVRFILPNDGK
ncbi:hypothetical protein SSX86_003294 [Deinandra increscens subsp. villosa]|uniref:Ubiquitin-like protease family profile domain-containing protein n=1 Tax=Deinandra increscens subsp. villosa TaxID=3103831 RepID=A0AAP0DKU2_9ASTR